MIVPFPRIHLLSPAPDFPDVTPPKRVRPRAQLKHYLQTHMQRGTPTMPDRTRFSGEIHEVKSPIDPETIFRIKTCGNDENIQRRDMSSTVRYFNQDDSDKVVTERDYPMGSRMVDTIMLVLVGWNITEKGAAVEINRENVVDFTDPEELEFLYEQAIEHNPMWDNNRDRKKS